MMRPTLLAACVLWILSSTAAQSVSFGPAESLSFIRPRLDTLSTNEAGTPQLRAGDNVTIEWATTYQSTTLVVYQNVGRNLFQSEVLAQGLRRDSTQIQWEVGAVPGANDLSGSFHFEIRNAVNPDCQGCSVNSGNFVVVRRDTPGSIATTSSRTQATTSTPSTRSGPSQTSTNTAGVAAAAATTQRSASATAAAASESSDDHLGTGLGVGLGVGIPVLIAIAVFAFLFRRQKKRRSSLPRGRQPSPAHSPERESGAWLYQDGRQSQQDMLFRPSTAARSEMSSWSHRSWIKPFDFEQVEMRDRDAMSQLRNSLYSNRRSEVTLSQAGSEWGMLHDIPEQPQPVHDGRWSQTV